jgi:3-methylfumaryl-CoA hydratase
MTGGDNPGAIADTTDTVSETAAVALHELLNGTGMPPSHGQPLPPLWHWLAFLPRSRQEDLGPDGHPQASAPRDYPDYSRRMFAGARIWFPGVANVGQPLRRQSEIVSVNHKEGRSGALLFVTIEHRYEADRQLVIREQQDIVYRPPSNPSAQPPDPDALTESTWTWSWELVAETTVLFRFSALTYNAHRIHYDRSYATDVEGYPGLVVQGPLQAIGLADVCRRHAGNRLKSFSFRALRPAFDGSSLQFRGRPGHDGIELAAFSESQGKTMEATATQ